MSELVTVQKRFLACLGLGVEYEISFAHLFENIAHLTKLGASKGTCSLTKDMKSYQHYKEAVMYVFDQQPEYPSVICSSVISAVEGHYGDYHLLKRTEDNQLRISALMPIYWFFDAATVAKQNLLIPHLRLSYSVEDTWSKMRKTSNELTPRKTPSYPLP